MENKNNFLKTASLSVLWGVIAISLCAVPCAWADEVVLSGETLNIDSTNTVVGNLEVFGTVNLYPGASVGGDIYVLPGTATDAPGGAMNVYGYASWNSLVLCPPNLINPGLPPVVTIYGQRFQIGEDKPFDPPVDIPISGTLKVLSESDDVLFSLWISSDIVIHLKAPGDVDEQDEEEPLKAELWVSPKVMHRQRRMPVVFATLRLPEGITKDDVDRDYTLLLYANENEGGIETNYQRMFQSCRRKTSRVKIFAFFNMAKLPEAFADDGEVELQVRGQLKTGQQFYGSDTIRIIGCRKRPWGHIIKGTRRHKNR